MKNPVAIIVGGTGQFGLTTAKYLLKKNYKIIITSRSKKKIKNLKNLKGKFIFYCLDIKNKNKIKKMLQKFLPNEIYYFAGQSSVSKSFFLKKETLVSNYNGCKNFLDTLVEQKSTCKFLNASSCEIYGNSKNIKISSKKKPVSPYGEAKLKSFNIVKKYRTKYNLRAYNAVIFNTESYLRMRNFLIPKICLAAINASKLNKKTTFGNLNISREWNWCDEQVKFLNLFLSKKPQDFILSNGKEYSATQMLNFAFKYFQLDYKKFILTSKKFMRRKDIQNKSSFWKECLNRNKIIRKPSIYGKILIIKLIKFYLNEKKYKYTA